MDSTVMYLKILPALKGTKCGYPIGSDPTGSVRRCPRDARFSVQKDGETAHYCQSHFDVFRDVANLAVDEYLAQKKLRISP